MRLKVLAVVTVGMLVCPSLSSAAGLPNGTCKGGGMTVTVQGGKIVGYKYGGQSYPVSAVGKAKYKIGSAGSLTINALIGKTIKATFSMGGKATPATFKCQ